MGIEHKGRPKARGSRSCYKRLLPSLPEHNESFWANGTEQYDGSSQAARGGKERLCMSISTRRQFAYAKALLPLAIAYSAKVVLGHVLLT